MLKAPLVGLTCLQEPLCQDLAAVLLFLGAESATASLESLKQMFFCRTLVAPREVNRCFMEKGVHCQICNF